MPVKMNSKSILMILLVLGISAALIVLAITLSRAPLKKAAAAALETSIIDNFGPGECLDTAIDSSGYIYAVGYTYNADGLKQSTLRKFSPEGERIFVKNPAAERAGNTTATGIGVDPNGYVYLNGNCEFTSPDARKTDDGYIVKFDPNGNEIISRIITFSDLLTDIEQLNDLHISFNGDLIFLVGYLAKLGIDTGYLHAVKNDLQDAADAAALDGHGNSRAISVASLPEGGCIAIYNIESRPDGTRANDILIRKHGNSLETIWSTYYGTPERLERANALFADSDGNIYLLGESGTDPNRESIIIKFNGLNGNIIWASETPLSGDDTADDGYAINGYLVVYGTRDKHACQIVLDAETGKEISIHICETEYRDEVNAISHNPTRDAVAITRTNLEGQKEGFLISCLPPISAPVYTHIGTFVTVTPNPNVTITYPEVTHAGYTSAIITTTAPEPPPGSTIIGITYNIGITGVEFTPPIILTITYDPNNLPTGVDEEDLYISRYDEESNSWIALTSTASPAVNTVTARTPHFSYFTIMAITDPSAAIQALINKVQSMNLQRGIENSLDAKLENAIEALEKAKVKEYSNAIAMLQAFVNECEAQKGKALTIAQADQLISEANAVIAAMQ